VNQEFFKAIEQVLAEERIGVYGSDGAEKPVVLARYLLNMALCESLYGPLQLVEIALRNTIHRALTAREQSEKWYGNQQLLLDEQSEMLRKSLQELTRKGKPMEPGRVVAELNLGFWTAFFNKKHARTGVGYYLAKHAFPQAPSSHLDMRLIEPRLSKIRNLRNRVFHHERILHWKDLDAQHEQILVVIEWVSPELRQMADALDRFRKVRSDGLAPWLETIRNHWPPQ